MTTNKNMQHESPQYGNTPYGSPQHESRQYESPQRGSTRPEPSDATRPPLWAPWYGIGFGRAVARFWRKAFVFHGRASRSEYWWAFLFLMLGSVALAAVGATADSAMAGAGGDSSPTADALSTLWLVVTFIPDLSLTIRRLHDENLRGWWVLLPYALELAAVVALVAGVAVGVVSGNASTSVWWLVAAVACYLLGEVAGAVLAVLPSRPQGARFDRPPVQAGFRTATGGLVGMDASAPFRPESRQDGAR